MTDKLDTLGDISHTNPYTGEVFGETQTYGRGQIVAADGGQADATADEHEETLADVQHTSTDGAQRTFNRGVDR